MSARILILEDDAVLSEMLRYLLETKGFQVKTAASGQDALALASEFKPRVLLLDIMLPDGNGLDFLEKLRLDAAQAALRVFVMSTVKSKSMRERAESLGALVYVAKPFEPHAFVAQIEKAAALP